MMKKILAACLMLLSSQLLATSAMAEPQSGVEYSPVLQVVPTDDTKRIEVTEIFWYGCPHCYDFEPIVSAWVKKFPANVYFKRVPGVPRPDWVPMAKAYYTLDALNLVDKLHVPLFDAIHKTRELKPTDEVGTIDWITKQSGLDRKRVEDTYRSFSINTKVMNAMQVFRATGATGVPTLLIDGKYISSATMAGGNDAFIKTADYLIAKAKQEKGIK